MAFIECTMIMSSVKDAESYRLYDRVKQRVWKQWILNIHKK